MKSILFVLGSTRSGTSAIRNALALTRYNGAGEGHTIEMLGALWDAIDTHFRTYSAALQEGTMLAEWNREEFWADITNAYFAQIRAVFPGLYYLDKTPNISPIRNLALIEKNFPDPSFVFCRRRGIDNVFSKARKWPETDFLIHCEEWRDIMNLWDETKPQLSRPWTEVEYLDLYVQPHKVADSIGKFLSLSPGDVEQILTHLLENRPPRLREDSAMSLDDTGWSDEQKRTFLEVCGPTMQRCGYGYYEYWRAAA